MRIGDGDLKENLKTCNMKYLLICLLFLISCDRAENTTTKGERVNLDESYTATGNNFQYRGHDYIFFKVGNASWGTHDPDCVKCKQQ